MEIRIIERWVDLDGPMTPEALRGALCGGEDQAHKFIIHARRGGQPVTLSGSVSGECVRWGSDTTVPVTGAIEDGAAALTLSESCYLQPGRVRITIFAADSSSTMAIYSFDAEVRATETGQVVDSENVLNVPALMGIVGDLEEAVETAQAYGYVSYSAADLAEMDTHPGSLGTTSSNNTTFNNVTNSNYKHVVVPVYPGTAMSVTANSSYEAVIAAARTYTEPTANGDSPDYSAATGWTKNIVINAGESMTGTIPEDAHYLIVSIKASSHNQMPAAFSTQDRLMAVRDDVDALDGRVDALESEVDIPETATADLGNMATHPGSLGNSAGNTRIFQNVGTANYTHAVVPVRPGWRVKLTANASYEAVIAAVKSYTEPTSDSAPDYSAWPGWDENVKIESGKSFDAPVPEDAHFILLSIRHGSHTQTPSAFSTGPHAIRHLLMGDSITDGSYSENGSLKSGAHNRTYGAWMSEKTGFTPTNVGIGGSGWKRCGNSSQSTKLNARMQIDNRDGQGNYVIDFTKYDLLTALWGVNDWKGSEPFGVIDFTQSVTPSYTAVSNPEGNPMYKGYYELSGSYYIPTTDTTVDGSKTYYSTPQDFVTNMRYFIETVQARNPALKIIIVSPLNSTTGDGNSAANDWGAGFEFAGKTLNDYCTAMRTICEHYGVQFVDMLHDSIINRLNAETMLPDGVHPSLDAHRQIGIALAGKIMYG